MSNDPDSVMSVARTTAAPAAVPCAVGRARAPAAPAGRSLGGSALSGRARWSLARRSRARRRPLGGGGAFGGALDRGPWGTADGDASNGFGVRNARDISMIVPGAPGNLVIEETSPPLSQHQFPRSSEVGFLAKINGNMYTSTRQQARSTPRDRRQRRRPRQRRPRRRPRRRRPRQRQRSRQRRRG